MTNTFDGERALADIYRICEFGPRPSGSLALESMRRFLEVRFQSMGIPTQRQSFRFAPKSQPKVVIQGINLIASYEPRRTKRLLFGTHYDTRPIADCETIPSLQKADSGANDGASGVAGVLELASTISRDRIPVGIDFVSRRGRVRIRSRS